MVTDEQMIAATKAYAGIDGKCRPAAMRAALEVAMAASNAEPVCTVAEIGAGGYRMLAPYPIDAINHLPVGTPLYTAPPAVAFKALEWTDEEYPRARCILGHYVINPYYRKVELIVGRGGLNQIIRAMLLLGKDASDAELKAAAQADYESSIRTALVSPADTSPEPVVPGWLVERVERCVLTADTAEFFGLADWAAFEAGQDNAIKCVVKMLRKLAAAPKDASHDD